MSTYKKGIAFIGFILISAIANAQLITGTVRGHIKGKNDGVPVDNVAIKIEKLNIGTSTDQSGNFILNNVPVGRVELTISKVGFASVILKELLLQSGQELIVEQELESSVEELDQVVVTAASPNLSGAVTSLQNITAEQIFRYPATFFDPARLAFTFPGVANANDQANGMSIRGNNPTFLQWRLEGMEIVNSNHLSNAGTFSDQPTANAGGTNMLSAQMLGNMNFLTGAFPAEYGNSLGGVMDMRLRKGNSQNYEHKAQVGLIGIDLSSEGPINRAKGSSYLFNYRYSFTGLLALGGLSFGGESISFQDLALNLHFPTAKLGTFSVFGMGGVNANEFEFEPEEEGGLPVFEKDLYTINYYGKMGVAGITHTAINKKNLTWKNALVYSGLKNNRDQFVIDNSEFNRPSLYNRNSTAKMSFSSIIQQNLSEDAYIKAGIYLTQQRDSLFQSNLNFGGLQQSLIVQPFVQFSTNIGAKTNFVLGLHNMNYSQSKTHTFEPRISFAHKITSKDQVSLAYGMHSQLHTATAYLWAAQVGNTAIAPNLAHHFVANYTHHFLNTTFKVEAYYQHLSNQLIVNENSSSANAFRYFSSVNLMDLSFPDGLVAKGLGKNFGLEMGIQRFLDNGFFYVANLTLYKSLFSNNEGEYTDAKYSGNSIANLTLGKEWAVSKSRLIGANIRLVYMGGFRDYEIDTDLSSLYGYTVYNYTKPLSVRYPAYFRPDLRLYFRKSKTKFSRMWSLDIQNVANYQNVAFDYFDRFQGKTIRKYQLGMIPLLSYRWEF